MYAIITAGGIPQPGESLYPYTQGASKALLDICGKAMIQWVVDAVCYAQRVEKVIIVGLPADAGIQGDKIETFLPNQGTMLQNLRTGMLKVLEIDPKAQHTLIASSDIPAITPEMVDWEIETTSRTNLDAYYTIIRKEVMEKRFPNSRRSYTRLKDMQVCGGDMNVIRTMAASGNDQLWERIIAARKNAFKQASLIGYDTLLLLLLRRIDLAHAVERVTRRLNLTAQAVISPYAEIGMDVDKPNQLELLRADLASRHAGATPPMATYAG
ncbi:MAG: NTP transferase domain-containing protein [Anaerolineales bacterium]